MSTALAERPANGAVDPSIVESVLIRGDLRQLTPAQKVTYYNSVCASLGLNPLTQPFAYITLNGKEVLYAKRDAAEQLRNVHNISVTIKAREVIEGIYVVTACATMPTGRMDESTGAVPIENVKGEARANALMKAETKAKRRVTLSICGLGMLDETEVESIPSAVTVEAPKARPPLPEGYVYLLSIASKQYGGDVTVVNASGEEATYPVPDRQCVALCEQVVQDGTPVKLTLVTGARDGRTKLKAIERWRRDEDAQIDAEIMAQDQPF